MRYRGILYKVQGRDSIRTKEVKGALIHEGEINSKTRNAESDAAECRNRENEKWRITKNELPSKPDRRSIRYPKLV